MKFGLIIVSDRVLLNPKLDKITSLVKEILKQRGYEVSTTFFVPNDVHEIRRAFYQLPNDVNIVLVCGGTGLGDRDVTVEALKPLFDKELIGFGEYFRNISVNDVGLKAIFSRSTAGRINDKMVFLLPGNPSAVKLALEKVILPQLKHFLETLEGISHWGINYIQVSDDIMRSNDLLLKYLARNVKVDNFVIAKLSKSLLGSSVEEILSKIQADLIIESPTYILLLFKGEKVKQIKALF